MPHPRHIPPARPLPTTISTQDITQGTAKLHEVLAAINDFSQEGFPYQDAARSKAELQLRECVKQIFGEDSQEFRTYRHYKLRTSNKSETARSIAAVKALLQMMEDLKLELQGAPASQAPVSTTLKTAPLNTGPLRLVPPAPQPPPSPAPSAPPAVSPAMTSHPKMSAIPVAPPMAPSPAPKTQKPPTKAAGVRPTPPRSKQAPATAIEAASAPAPPPHEAPTSSAIVPPQPASTELPAAVSVPPLSATQPILATPAPTAHESSPSAPAAPPPPTPTEMAPAVPTATQPIPLTPAPSAPAPMPTAAHTAPEVPSPNPEPEQESLQLIRKVCLRLHTVARQLRLRKDSRPTIEIEDDHDLQDLLRALLKLEFDEVGVDEWTPPYAGSTPKTALLLNREQIVLVVKKTRPGLTMKEIAEQVMADSAFYSARNQCSTLFCFVYDPEGRIGSPKRLETDLTSVSNRYTVEVLVAPK